jgi:hypothetical protein
MPIIGVVDSRRTADHLIKLIREGCERQPVRGGAAAALRRDGHARPVKIATVRELALTIAKAAPDGRGFSYQARAEPL